MGGGALEYYSSIPFAESCHAADIKAYENPVDDKDDEGEEHGAPWTEVIVVKELFFALLGVVPPVVVIVAVLVAVVLPVAEHDHGSPNDYTQLQN